MSLTNINNDTLKTMLENNPRIQVVDVRTEQEFKTLGHIPKAISIPIHELPYAYRMLEDTEPVVLVCEHGVRSVDAYYFLQAQGYTDLFNLEQGMADWDGERVFDA